MVRVQSPATLAVSQAKAGAAARIVAASNNTASFTVVLVALFMERCFSFVDISLKNRSLSLSLAHPRKGSFAPALRGSPPACLQSYFGAGATVPLRFPVKLPLPI